MKKQIEWHVEPDEQAQIDRISKRIMATDYLARHFQSEGDAQMDIIATHNMGCPLDLEKLADAPDFDFAHDIGGIMRHLDRETGELRDCFLPRCSLPDVPVNADSIISAVFGKQP